MKLTEVELRRITLPLVTPFHTAAGAQTSRDLLLVRVAGPDGEGWGECAALAAPVYSPEYVDGAAHVIRTYLLPRLFASGDLSAEQVGSALAGVKGHPMAKSTLEMAILDAELRHHGISFGTYLGAVRDRVPSGVSIGITPSIPELLDVVGGYLDQGYVRVKLKIQPGWDLAPVQAVRERFGDELALQVDANAAYTLADADHLAGLDPFALLLIEQPLAEEDLDGHAQLATRITTPICLDESITSAGVAADAIRRRACAIVNIKAGRVGGYLEARRIHDVCASEGVPVWCGGMLESGLARAANVALAAMENFRLPG
ncbi:MAG: o-succinylbenzoate synthase, partial [Actinomycetota bacterium]|nr:o-succinylbenzoate synthase [Actinomycetota bacterium]